MGRINKRIVAREWLFFLSCFLIGLIRIIFELNPTPKSFGDFLAFILVPYIVVQLIRLVIFSIKILLRKVLWRR
jgi:hypothetical protein